MTVTSYLYYSTKNSSINLKTSKGHFKHDEYNSIYLRAPLCLGTAPQTCLFVDALSCCSYSGCARGHEGNNPFSREFADSHWACVKMDDSKFYSKQILLYLSVGRCSSLVLLATQQCVYSGRLLWGASLQACVRLSTHSYHISSMPLHIIQTI